MAGVFDAALDKRFSESPELTLANVDGVDVLLIHNAADGSVYRIQASTLASFINSAIAQADILDALNAPNGVATLDSGGKVPAAQLPAYVDDVLEYATASAFPVAGEAGKIYVALDSNLTYRWSGSAYVEISKSLALGETSGTAYRGDRGKTAYDHSQSTGNPHGTSKADVGLGNVDNTSDANKPVSTAQQTALNLKMDKALPAWTDFAAGDLTNNWVNYGAGYANAGYYKDDHGVVHLKGFVKSGTLQQAMFTLPSGFRPPHTIYIAVLSGQAVGGLLIYSSGVVMLYFGSNTFVSLENIHFRT